LEWDRQEEEELERWRRQQVAVENRREEDKRPREEEERQRKEERRQSEREPEERRIKRAQEEAKMTFWYSPGMGLEGWIRRWEEEPGQTYKQRSEATLFAWRWNSRNHSLKTRGWR
jgi:hypothetical protein